MLSDLCKYRPADFEAFDALLFHPSRHVFEDPLALQLVMQIMATAIPKLERGHPPGCFRKRLGCLRASERVFRSVHQKSMRL